MKKQLELLVKVQSIDTQIRKSEEIQKKYQDDMAQLENELKTEEEVCTKAKEELQLLEKEHRKRERDLEEILSRKEKAQDKLFSIKTNKEYQAALLEIEGIKGSIKKQEDEILEIMEKLESRKGELKKAEELLKKHSMNYVQRKQQLEEALNCYLQELEEQKQVRIALIDGIDPNLLRDYTTLREAKHGLAVAMTHNELCMGCNMKIPPQTYNEVITSDTIIFCPNCRRILYIEKEATPKGN